MKDPIDTHDQRRFPYCPQLGGAVTFRHCRTLGRDSLCPRIIHCWQRYFDVAVFLVQHFDADMLRELVSQPREDKLPKLVNLVRDRLPKED
jgi:hypothetical protein